MKQRETGNDHDRVTEVFLQACDLTAHERAAFLDRACRGEPEVRSVVERMLAADRTGADLLDDDAIERGDQFGDAAPSEPVPRSVGPFRVIREIGRGGMGVVYEARQRLPDRRVAVKLIRAGAVSAQTLARFRIEAEALGRLQHPGIAQVYEVGNDGHGETGRPYLAMEFIEGVALNAYCERFDSCYRDRLELIARICDAVHHAHQKGVIHRDLKPENVLVTDPIVAGTGSASASNTETFLGLGFPKILDFGIARLNEQSNVPITLTIHAGQLIGTLAYMSPEQLQNARDADVRTDIYAIGVMAYELISGLKPIDVSGLSIPAAMRMIEERVPDKLSRHVPKTRGDIETIIAKAMEKDPDARYKSAAELGADIRRYLADEPVLARAPSKARQLRRLIRRNKGIGSGLATGLAALVLGAGVSSWYAVMESRQRKLTEQALYEAMMASAGQAFDDDNWSSCRFYLDRAPQRLRGWEWNYFDHAIQTEAETVALHRESPSRNSRSMAWDQTSNQIVCFGKPSEHEIGGPFVLRIDPESGTMVKEIQLAKGIPTEGAWLLSKDGNRAINQTNSLGSASVWDTQTGLMLERSSLPESSDQLDWRIGAFHPVVKIDQVTFVWNGNRWWEAPSAWQPKLGPLLVSSPHAFQENPNSIAILSATTGEVLQTLQLPQIKASSAFTPDGRTLLVSCDSGVLVGYETETWEELPWSPAEFGVERMWIIGFDSEGKSVLIRGADRVLRWVSLNTGETEASLPLSTRTRRILIDPNSDKIVAQTSTALNILADFRDRRNVYTGHDEWVNPIELDPSSQMLYSGSWDGTVRVWDTKSGLEQARIDLPDSGSRYTAVLDLELSPDGREFALIVGGGPYSPLALHRYSTDNLAPISGPIALGRGPASIEYGVNGQLHVRTRSTVIEGFGNQSIALVSDPGRLVVLASARGDRDQIAYVMSEDPAELVVSRPNENEIVHRSLWGGSRITAIAFSTDAAKLAIGQVTGEVLTLDIATGTTTPSSGGHQDEVLAVAYSPDGSRLASAARDGAIIIWNTVTMQRVGLLSGHRDYVFDLEWSMDGSSLFSSSGDQTIRAWHAVTNP